MKKIKKFLSVLFSGLMLLGGKFAENKVSAINENKIVCTNKGRKFIYISTEDIPKVLELLRSKLEKESKKRFSTLGNIGYKTLTAGAGVALGVSAYLGASKMKDKNMSKATAALSCTAIGLGTLAALFVPEYVKAKTNSVEKLAGKCYSDSSAGSRSGWSFGNLLTELERVMPDPEYRKKHNKNEYKGEEFDPSYSDLGMGVIVGVSPSENGGVEFSLSRQGSSLFLDEKNTDIEEDWWVRFFIKRRIGEVKNWNNVELEILTQKVKRHIKEQGSPEVSEDRIVKLINDVKNSPDKEIPMKKFELDSGKAYYVHGCGQTSKGYYILEGGVDRGRYSDKEATGNVHFDDPDPVGYFFGREPKSETREVNSWDETSINEFFSSK